MEAEAGAMSTYLPEIQMGEVRWCLTEIMNGTTSIPFHSPFPPLNGSTPTSSHISRPRKAEPQPHQLPATPHNLPCSFSQPSVSTDTLLLQLRRNRSPAQPHPTWLHDHRLSAGPSRAAPGSPSNPNWALQPAHSPPRPRPHHHHPLHNNMPPPARPQPTSASRPSRSPRSSTVSPKSSRA